MGSICCHQVKEERIIYANGDTHDYESLVTNYEIKEPDNLLLCWKSFTTFFI